MFHERGLLHLREFAKFVCNQTYIFIYQLNVISCHHNCSTETSNNYERFNIRRSSSLASCFVESTSANVANPFDDIVVGVVELGLKHFQIANL
jgi:hypothetical protein